VEVNNAFSLGILMARRVRMFTIWKPLLFSLVGMWFFHETIFAFSKQYSRPQKDQNKCRDNEMIEYDLCLDKLGSGEWV